MLTRSDPTPRNVRRERRLWLDESRYTASLGCLGCRDAEACGRLHLKASIFDCLDFCCAKPESCDRVCRNNSDYVDRVREIGGFALDNVPRAPKLHVIDLPLLVPIIFHRSRRKIALEFPTVALSLYQVFSRRSGAANFSDPQSVRRSFGIAPESRIILTGTDLDPPLERWWGLGETTRRATIRDMKAMKIDLVTTPNFSLMIDRPRWDDLHAIKRIALIHEEFLAEGLPAALHVNGRTDRDFFRWGKYLAERPEVTHIAYEFTTGTARRPLQHAVWLSKLAETAGRPIHLVVRGGIEVMPILAQAFSGLTFLDTSIFMKTMMRQRAVPNGNANISWRRAPTEKGASLDDLLASNLATVDRWMGNVCPTEITHSSVLA